MADFGSVTGKRSRADKIENRLRKVYSREQVTPEDDAVVRATARFLGSFGAEVVRLNRTSKARLREMDPEQMNVLKDRAVAELQAQTREELASALDYYKRGRISLTTLRDNIQSALRQEALGSAIIGVGGVGNLNENVLLAVRRQITDAFRLLDGYIEDIQGRAIVPRDQARLAMFGNAAHTIAQTAQRQFKLDALSADTAILEERRVLGGGEHCDDCIELAAEGWQDAGQLPPIGQDTVCGNSCRCTIETRIKGSGFYPSIDLAESAEIT